MAFNTTLTPTPAAGKAIPYDWFTKLLENTNELYNGLRGSQTNITSTGTLNDHDVDTVSVTVSNASALTITGAVPLGDGAIRIYENIGTSTVAFASQSGSSAAANRFILPATTLLIGENGAVGLRYDGTVDRWRLLFHTPGKSIAIAHSAGNYAADGTTWGVDSADQKTAQYAQRGALVDLVLEVEDSDVGGATAYLKFTLPNSWAVRTARRGRGTANLRNAGTYGTGQWIAVPGETFVRFYQDDTTATWGATTSDNTNVAATMLLEVA